MKRKLLSMVLTLSMMLFLIPTFTIQATTTVSNIGDYLTMGTYYGELIIWRCVDIDENGLLMLSDKILTIKPFDAKGASHLYADGTPQVDNGNDRINYGSNLWEMSSIRSWLNSTATAGNVPWPDGNPPTADNVGYSPYAGEKGFLAEGNFTASERNVIKSVTQKAILSIYDRDKLNIDGTDMHSNNNGNI